MINQIILKQNHPHYQEGIHFENPKLKYLTKENISELIQERITLETEFPDDNFVRTFKKNDYHYSTFMLSSDFDYELTKQDILNPTDNKLKDLFAYLSNLLFTPDDSQYESLILSNIVDAIRERFTYTQLVELLEHLAYPELIGFDGITVYYIYTLILRKSPFGVHASVQASNGDGIGFYETFPIKTLDCPKTIEDIKTITEIKEFVKNLDDSEIEPRLTMGFIYPKLED
jgi:hypothetical protein